MFGLDSELNNLKQIRVMMKRSIAIIKEKNVGERRVILLPSEIGLFINLGYEVFVEENAGLCVGMSNDDYIKCGATILTASEIWRSSPFIVKYKAPNEQEYHFLREGTHLCALFHAEGNIKLVNELCKRNLTAYSYEFFKTKDNIFPLAVVGGEIAGKMAVIYGIYHLQASFGGSGVLMMDIYGAKKGKAIVIGYGNVGSAAIKTLIALGNDVIVFGTNKGRLAKFQRLFGNSIECKIYEPTTFEQELQDADLVIGAILISTFDTPSILGESALKKMKKGSMIIDVTCGYGNKGYMSTFEKTTNFKEPVYIKEGVLHCKIDILPSNVPITTSQAFSRNVAPYLVKLGDAIYDNKFDEVSSMGKIIENGQIVNSIVNENINLIKQISINEQ